MPDNAIMKDKEKSGLTGVMKSDREQRLQVLNTLLAWTAEEFQELGLPHNAETIKAIQNEIERKLGH